MFSSVEKTNPAHIAAPLKNILTSHRLDRSAATISQMYITGSISAILTTDGRNIFGMSSLILSTFPSLKGVVREEQAAESTS